MKENQFINFAEKILKETKTAMSAKEIWDYGVERGYQTEINTLGKTPSATLSAQLYTSNKSKNLFSRIGTRPTRFVLREYSANVNIVDLQKKQHENETNENDLKYKEKDLHPILVYYLRTYKKIFAKTINQSKSSKQTYGQWIHPDIVACHFPFEEWNDNVFELNKNIADPSVILYSFELKRKLNFSNLRESFFQAVSNSSWANEGYLVAAEIDIDEEFRTELKRLCSSFGIGVIEIDKSNPDNTDILFPAKFNKNIDWETVDKLSNEDNNGLDNDDFNEFITAINKSIKATEVQSKYFDKVKDPNDIKIC